MPIKPDALKNVKVTVYCVLRFYHTIQVNSYED